MARVRDRRSRADILKGCLVENAAFERTLTELDHVRLLNMLHGLAPLLRDCRSGTHSWLTLCHPAEAEPALDKVSVLSPVGSALLGLQCGCVARWSTSTGDKRAAEILAATFQRGSRSPRAAARAPSAAATARHRLSACSEGRR